MSAEKTRGNTTLQSFDEFFSSNSAVLFGDRELYLNEFERQKLEKQGLNVRTPLQWYIDQNGIYGNPKVIDNEKDFVFAKGMFGITLYRGMPDSGRSTGEYKLNNFIHDNKYYVGEGIYGDGIYFAGNVGVANNYALSGDAIDGHGAVMRAKIKPDAKVAYYDDIYHDYMQHHKDKYCTSSQREGLISCYARSLGYDILIYGGANEGGYFNVLNRSALIVNSNIERKKGNG